MGAHPRCHHAWVPTQGAIMRGNASGWPVPRKRRRIVFSNRHAFFDKSSVKRSASTHDSTCNCWQACTA
eukprot:171754-Chlamydomonas_euryale.AAC.1